MRTTRNLLFGCLLMGCGPLAAQDCKMVFDAMTKVIDTPTHAFVTMNMEGASHTAESIYVGGLVYANFGGKWSPGTSTQDLKTLAEKNRRDNKTSCRFLKDESVGGETAAVYSVHEVSPQATSDSKIWISKAKGLPLRSDLEMDGGKNRISTRYEYGNVKPPV